MWIIIAAIIILVIFADSDTKPSTTKKETLTQPRHCTAQSIVQGITVPS